MYLKNQLVLVILAFTVICNCADKPEKKVIDQKQEINQNELHGLSIAEQQKLLKDIVAVEDILLISIFS